MVPYWILNTAQPSPRGVNATQLAKCRDFVSCTGMQCFRNAVALNLLKHQCYSNTVKMDASVRTLQGLIAFAGSGGVSVSFQKKKDFLSFFLECNYEKKNAIQNTVL